MTLIEFDPDFSELAFASDEVKAGAEEPSHAVLRGEVTPADELVIPVEFDEMSLYYFNPKRRF